MNNVKFPKPEDAVETVERMRTRVREILATSPHMKEKFVSTLTLLNMTEGADYSEDDLITFLTHSEMTRPLVDSVLAIDSLDRYETPKRRKPTAKWTEKQLDAVVKLARHSKQWMLRHFRRNGNRSIAKAWQKKPISDFVKVDMLPHLKGLRLNEAKILAIRYHLKGLERDGDQQ